MAIEIGCNIISPKLSTVSQSHLLNGRNCENIWIFC